MSARWPFVGEVCPVCGSGSGYVILGEEETDPPWAWVCCSGCTCKSETGICFHIYEDLMPATDIWFDDLVLETN